MYRFGGDSAELDFLRYDVTNIAYRIRNHGRSAVIGVGGGRDMLSAHKFGFEDVTGVELNPIFIDWLTHRFRNYNHLADLPDTRFFVDEARSWFARTTERFDLIEMSLIDTWAATGAGAFSLSENGLYTVEGWQHFLNALTPTGVFTVSRWYDPRNITETGRLLSLASAALRSHGAVDPRAQIFLAAVPTLATIIVANAPFSSDDLSRLHTATAELGFTELVSPDREVASPVLRRVLARGQHARHGRTDAIIPYRPHGADRRQAVLLQPACADGLGIDPGRAECEDGVIRGNLEATKTIGVIVLLSAILVLVTMIIPSLPAVRRAQTSLAWFGTLYFALIGLGFMFIEIGIIQRVSLFLGHPVYGLAIGLFSIILSTGIGSLISELLRLDTAAKLVAWSVSLCALVILLSFWFPAVVGAFEGHSPRGARRRVACRDRALRSADGIWISHRHAAGEYDRHPAHALVLGDQRGPWAFSRQALPSVRASPFRSTQASGLARRCYLLLAPVSILLLRITRDARGVGDALQSLPYR